MTTTGIRKMLHEFITDAADSKVKGLYLLLEDEIVKKNEWKPSSRHLEILEEEKRKHWQGLSKSFSREEAKQFIRGNKKVS